MVTAMTGDPVASRLLRSYSGLALGTEISQVVISLIIGMRYRASTSTTSYSNSTGPITGWLAWQ